MGFTRIEPINKIESNLFTRHRIAAMKDGDLVQRCIFCGEVINDYSSQKAGSPVRSGSPEGDVYVNKSSGGVFMIYGAAVERGDICAPKEFIDCIAINS